VLGRRVSHALDLERRLEPLAEAALAGAAVLLWLVAPEQQVAGLEALGDAVDQGGAVEGGVGIFFIPFSSLGTAVSRLVGRGWPVLG